MDCLGTLEIAYVELTGIVLFREEKHAGGILAYQVYAVRTDMGIVVIRATGRYSKNKRIGMKWLNKQFNQIFQTSVPYSRIECIKFLINEINIKKIYWKHKITEMKMVRILEAVNKSKEIYL